MSHVTILFGEMGGGKNYHGLQVAEKTSAHFFDGDDVVTPEMLEKVKQFKPLTEDLLEEYLDILFEEIADLAQAYDKLVVAQALYLDEDRKDLERFLVSLGHRVEFVWINTPLWRNFKQLLTRPRGWGWVYYWLINKPFFQKPTHLYKQIR